MRKIIVSFALAVLFLSLGQIGLVRAEEPPPVEPPALSEMPTMPGRLEGSGTHFALTDSQYLNITLDNSEPIKLILESVPEMVTLHIEPASGAVSTQITLGGFAPETTYYKYEDDYHNLLAFTTDASGTYAYTQDLSQVHLIFIQPRASTIYLNDTTGWSQPVGNWDSVTRTATLTQDVTETIQIDSNNIALDGNGHTVTGTNTGNGVYLYGRTGVTIKNLTVRQFWCGICLDSSSSNTLTSNTASNNTYGIVLGNYSSNNTVSGNAADSNAHFGIYLLSSSNNTLTSNTATNNSSGIVLYHGSNSNTLTGNTASNNSYGILLYLSNSNTLTGNTANSNNSRGIYLDSSSSNKVYNNNFISNSTQAYVSGGSGNVFNLDKPVGGNYWSNWTSPDNDTDGFVDNPYVFTGGQDNLPWTKPYGWDKSAPTTSISLSGTLGNNGWYKSDVQVALTATDNEGGSGVARTEYSFDDTTWNTYTAPFMVSAEGTATVYYRSTDNAGNVEAANSQTIKIDKTPPTITGAPTTSPNANGWYNADIVVHFTASDATSDIDTVTPDITISTEGANQSVTGTATDKAGNSASATVNNINIDKTPPKVTIDSPKDGKTYLNTQGSVPVNYTAIDICDPHPDITMTLDGNTFNGSKIDLCGMASGQHTLVVSATDESGNTGTASVTFRIEPQSLKAFVIRGMTINWAHDKFSIWGRFQLPEGYNMAKLKKQATTSIVISGSSGNDTVIFNESSLNLRGIIWRYMGNEQPPGENMNIREMIVWWAPQGTKWAGWAGFYISGVLQLPEGIGVNSQPASATVTIEIPVTTQAGCGSLEGEQKITFKVNKPLYLWSYNVWPNLLAFPCDPTD